MTTIVRVIFAIFDIIFIFILAILTDLTAKTSFKGEIFIPKGSATKIISNLSHQNLNVNKLDPKILDFIGTVKSGYLDLGDTNLTKIDLFYKLTTAKPVMSDIIIIPGETTVVFLEEIAKKENLDFNKLEFEYNKTTPFYEGFLIPETYHLAKGYDEKELISVLVKNSLKIHKNLINNYEKEHYKTIESDEWKNILAKASVIQKEAANKDEMKIVSSVIDNRLDKGMRLQMDGTLNYGKFSHIKITPDRIRNDESKFNTYLNDGLPPIVCMVSIEAIDAAINPVKTEYLYFMRDKRTNKHIFTKTHSEHLKQVNIQRNLK